MVDVWKASRRMAKIENEPAQKSRKSGSPAFFVRSVGYLVFAGHWCYNALLLEKAAWLTGVFRLPVVDPDYRVR
jgi:hypothetical protein